MADGTERDEMAEPKTFVAHDSYVLGLQFTADSGMLVSCGMDNVVKLWDVPGWQLIRTIEAHKNSVHTMGLTPDERTLVTGSSDTTVRLWSFPDGDLMKTLQDRKKVVSSVRISRDGEWIGAGSYGGRAMIWTIKGEPVLGIQASKKNLSTLDISPDKKLLATAGLGDEIRLWDLTDGAPAGVLTGHEIAVMTIRFVEDGRRLISLGYDQTIRFWDTNSWQETHVLKPSAPTARGLIVSQDETKLALLMESQVEIRSIEGWELEEQLSVGTKSIGSAAFSPDGRMIAVGAADRKIRIWQGL